MWSSRRRCASTHLRRPTTSATAASSSTCCEDCSQRERLRRDPADVFVSSFTQTLRDLLAARGPAGYETAPAAVWSAAAQVFGAQVQTDVVGTPSARVAPRVRAGHRPNGNADSTPADAPSSEEAPPDATGSD